MSEKMPKSQELPSALEAKEESKVERKERSGNISIPVEMIINLINKSVVNEKYPLLKKNMSWGDRDILYKAEQKAKEPMLKFLSEEHPEILDIAQTINKNEERVKKLSGELGVNFSTDVAIEAEALYQDTNVLWKKFIGQDNYQGMQRTIDIIHNYAQRDLEQLRKKEKTIKDKQERAKQLKKLLNEVGVESLKDLPAYPDEYLDKILTREKYEPEGFCCAVCDLNRFIYHNDEKKIAHIAEALYKERPELKKVKAFMLGSVVNPILIIGQEIFNLDELAENGYRAEDTIEE